MTIDDAPSAGTADRLIRNALLAELRREAEDADGQKTQRLHLVARTLVEKALAGEVTAIKEINERVDGKSVLGTRGADEGHRVVTLEWKSGDE